MSDFSAVPVPVLVFDGAGAILSANRAACDLLGMPEAELKGMTAERLGWIMLRRPGSPPSDAHPVTTVLSTRVVTRGVVASVARPDGTLLWVQADAWPALSATGDVTTVTLLLTDISPLLMGGPLAASGGDELMAAVTRQFVNVRLDPEAILATLVNTISKLRSGTWVGMLLNRDPSTLRVMSANEYEPELTRFVDDFVGIRRGIGDAPLSGMTQQVIESGQPVFAPNATWDQFLHMMSPEAREFILSLDYEPSRAWRHLGVLMVPLRSRGASLGVLGVIDTRASYPLTERDREWVQEVADRAGVAIENAQLYADAVSRLERLTTLRSLGLAIGASQDLRVTLQMILDHVISDLGVDAADILLVDETDGMLTNVASSGFHSTSVPEYRLPVDDALPGRVLTGRRIETVTVLGAFSQFRRRSLFAREGFKAYGAVPLIARGKLSGVLEVFHRSQLQPDQEWISFLDALAGDAGLAIDNATMFEKLRTTGTTQTPGRSKLPAPALSPVERSVLSHLVEGSSNREIAAIMHLSQNTIKFHVRQLLQKTGSANRTEIARRATQEGWL